MIVVDDCWGDKMTAVRGGRFENLGFAIACGPDVNMADRLCDRSELGVSLCVYLRGGHAKSTDDVMAVGEKDLQKYASSCSRPIYDMREEKPFNVVPLHSMAKRGLSSCPSEVLSNRAASGAKNSVPVVESGSPPPASASVKGRICRDID